MDSATLTAYLKSCARELGFSLAGVTAAVPPAGQARLDEWLAAGYAGQMSYIADRRDAYGDPRRVLDGARSVLMLAMDYRSAEPVPTKPGHGRVSRYAWGTADYHDLIRDHINQLADYARELAPTAQVRGVVDTAPLLEREFAQLAGLGWVGKHTLLINRDCGSWFFLAALLTDVELVVDQPFTADHCGTCRACLDACPTNAFPQPYVLDARRCISYLTIELRDAIPTELRQGMEDWVFGCDICQEVCPWNSHSQPSVESAFTPIPDMNPLDLVTLFDLNDDDFRARFRHTPLWRSKRRGLLRNAAILLGNRPNARALPAIIRALSDFDPLVRGACAWALGNYAEPLAAQALQQRLENESDDDVRREISQSLTLLSRASLAP